MKFGTLESFMDCILVSNIGFNTNFMDYTYANGCSGASKSAVLKQPDLVYF